MWLPEDVHFRNVHESDANLIVLATGPGNGLLQPFDDARPDCRPPLRRTEPRLLLGRLGIRIHNRLCLQ